MIEIKNVSKRFGDIEAVSGVSLTWKDNNVFGLLGTNGAGKSTLLNILGGLMTMDEGELRVGGKKVDFRKKKYLLNYRRREVGFVVQYFALIDDMNVYKNVSLPLRYQGIPGAKTRQRTKKMLRNLGIEEKAKSYPGELSGGQQQRAAIARALVKNAKIILADEPTGALDEDTGNDVMKLFQRLKMKDRAIIIVTHDSKVAEYCDRIVYLRDGANV